MSPKEIEDAVRVSSGHLDSVRKVFGMKVSKRFLEGAKGLPRKCLEMFIFLTT